MICFRLCGILLRFEFGFFAVFGLLSAMSIGSSLHASVCAAFLHEGAHLLVMRIFRLKLHSVTFCGCGIRIRAAHILCDYRQELLVLLAGPVSNLLAWGLLSRFGGSEPLMAANLVLGLVNLLPCRNLDGGAALRCVFSLTRQEPWLSEQIVSWIACVILLLLILIAWILGVRNFTYYALCIYLFFAEIFR